MASIDVEWWPLDRVLPYDANPRLRSDQQIEDLAKSLLEFGWKSYLNVDADGVLITGHGRRLAALRLKERGELAKLHPEGLVPVVVERNLPPEKVRAFRILDNKVAEGSKWDEELLKLEMAELLELIPDQIDLTGFSLEAAMELLGGDGDDPPSQFKRVDPDEKTEHRCPKCGYEWNGKAA